MREVPIVANRPPAWPKCAEPDCVFGVCAWTKEGTKCWAHTFGHKLPGICGVRAGCFCGRGIDMDQHPPVLPAEARRN